MKPSLEQCNAWFAREAVPGVAFTHEDGVDVVQGEYSGESGALISVEELGDDPLYLVELGSGKDVYVRQSCLAPVSDA